MSKKEIKKYQTLLDYATQHTGTAEGLFDVAVANGKSITEPTIPGEVLEVQVTDARVANFFDNSGLDIISIKAEGLQGGIGYMQIGTNFKVS